MLDHQETSHLDLTRGPQYLTGPSAATSSRHDDNSHRVATCTHPQHGKGRGKADGRLHSFGDGLYRVLDGRGREEGAQEGRLHRHADPDVHLFHPPAGPGERRQRHDGCEKFPEADPIFVRGEETDSDVGRTSSRTLESRRTGSTSARSSSTPASSSSRSRATSSSTASARSAGSAARSSSGASSPPSRPSSGACRPSCRRACSSA